MIFNPRLSRPLTIVAILFSVILNSTGAFAQDYSYDNKMGAIESARKTLCLNGFWNTACSSESVDILKCAREYTGEQAQRICQYELGLWRRVTEWSANEEAKRAAVQVQQERLRRIAAPKEQAPASINRQPKPNLDSAKLNVPANRELTPSEIQGGKDALSYGFSNRTPPVPIFSNTDERLHYQNWFDRIDKNLTDVIPELNSRTEFLQTVWYESKRAGLKPSVILGLIETTSNFRKFYVSEDGARGFMGVMPKWTQQLGDSDTSKLFHLQTNLRFGCVVLRHYLDQRNGNLKLALRDYSESNHLLIDNKNQAASKFPILVLRNELHWLK